MSDYDDTNKGVMFPPYEDHKYVLNGKVNIEGDEQRLVGIRQKLSRDGEPVIVVYKQAGILYPNDKKGNDKAPDYSGPIDDRANLRWAAWRGEKNGTKYIQIKVSEKQGGSSGSNSSNSSKPENTGEHDPFNMDDVPF